MNYTVLVIKLSQGSFAPTVGCLSIFFGWLFVHCVWLAVCPLSLVGCLSIVFGCDVRLKQLLLVTVCMYLCMAICLSVYLSFGPSFGLSVCLFVCQYT